MSLPLIPFYFVRHGETEANVARQVAGYFDSPLTSKGRQQADSLARICERLDIKPTRIFHSDLSRARDTAYAVNSNLGLDINEMHELREHHFGVHEGKMHWNDVFEILESGHAPENGESYDMFYKRTMTVFSEIITNNNDPILITAHGGFMHQIQHMLGRGQSYTTDAIV